MVVVFDRRPRYYLYVDVKDRRQANDFTPALSRQRSHFVDSPFRSLPLIEWQSNVSREKKNAHKEWERTCLFHVEASQASSRRVTGKGVIGRNHWSSDFAGDGIGIGPQQSSLSSERYK